MKENLLQQILLDDSLLSLFSDFSQIHFLQTPEKLEAFSFESSENFEVFATDEFGGIFVRIKQDIGNKELLPIWFISCEAETLKVANSFQEFLQLIIYYPFWQELLNFTSTEIMKEVKKLKKENENAFEEYLEEQKELADSFDIKENEQILFTLLNNVNEKINFKITKTINE